MTLPLTFRSFDCTFTAKQSFRKTRHNPKTKTPNNTPTTLQKTMGCTDSKEQEEPVKVEEKPKAVLPFERKRSPTPDKEIQDQGTLFALVPTGDEDDDAPK